MSVFKKPNFDALSKPEEKTEKKKRTYKNLWDNGEKGQKIVDDLLDQINTFHSMDVWADKELEAIILKQKQYEYQQLDKKPQFPQGLVRFSPSSTDKCERELYYKATHATKDDETSIMFPFQRRWAKNGTAVHERMQNDLLYSAKYVENAKFHPVILDNGLPAWEKNIAKTREFDHKGVKFCIYGMCDGILTYKDGKEEELTGFEFKTKSTTVAAVGDFIMGKGPQESHLMQVYSYFLLYPNIKQYVILYESVAKDGWAKGAEAKPDLRAFYIENTEEKRNLVLDKFAEVAKSVEEEELPEKDEEKCLFCPFKGICKGDN